MSKKTYVIMFNDKADYDLFRHRFPPSGAANRNPEPRTATPDTEEPTKADASATPEAEAEAKPPAVKPELGTYLKYTAGNFVSALAKAFAGKPARIEKEEQQDSSLPASLPVRQREVVLSGIFAGTTAKILIPILISEGHTSLSRGPIPVPFDVLAEGRTEEFLVVFVR